MGKEKPYQHMLSLTRPPVALQEPPTTNEAELRAQIAELERQNSQLLTMNRVIAQFLIAQNWYVLSRGENPGLLRTSFYEWRDSVHGTEWFSVNCSTPQEIMVEIKKLTDG